MSRARHLALSGTLLCALAALLGTPALYVPGIALVLAAVLAPSWVALSAARARLTLQGGPATAYEGENVTLTLALRRGRLPFPDAQLVPWPGAGAVEPPPRRRAQLELSVVPSRRGRHTLGPASLRVADPLGVCSREVRSAAHELLVLPRVHPVNAPALARARVARVAPASSARDAADELDGLRPYAAGAPASRIHWPTVARTGVLMQRSFTADADQRALVVLDAGAPDCEDSLDRALRAAASLCVHLGRRGGCELLLPGDRRPVAIGPDLRAWPAQHARLALVRAGAGAGSVRALRHGARTVLYVTGARGGRPNVGGRFYRVAPHALAGVGVEFTVAGCFAQLLDGAAGRRAR